MTTLHWDLTEYATRTQLLESVYSYIGKECAHEVRATAVAAGVPDFHHHNLAELEQTIDDLVVSDNVKMHMRAIYQILAEAEATAHACAVDETHFHEVGNAEGIRNVAEICLALESVNPQRITATPAQTGEGKVKCAHGELSIPAPATAAIIARGIPVYEATLPGERMTPTSAAIILHFVDEFIA